MSLKEELNTGKEEFAKTAPPESLKIVGQTIIASAEVPPGPATRPEPAGRVQTLKRSP